MQYKERVNVTLTGWSKVSLGMAYCNRKWGRLRLELRRGRGRGREERGGIKHDVCWHWHSLWCGDSYLFSDILYHLDDTITGQVLLE